MKRHDLSWDLYQMSPHGLAARRRHDGARSEARRGRGATAMLVRSNKLAVVVGSS